MYDCLNNDRIYHILRASSKKTFDSSSSSENENENDEGTDEGTNEMEEDGSKKDE